MYVQAVKNVLNKNPLATIQEIKETMEKIDGEALDDDPIPSAMVYYVKRIAVRNLGKEKEAG